MKVAFVHGRPGPHPFHGLLARSVKADFFFVDRRLRWHDREEASSLRRYLSWIVNAVLFPASRYDMLLSEGLHVMPLLVKFFHPFSKIRIVGLMDNEQPFFTYSGRYGPITLWVNRIVFNMYDYHICSSEMIERLVKRYKKDSDRVLRNFNAVSSERIRDLNGIQPAWGSGNILFIGNGPGEWRAWYKGLDILLAAFVRINKKFTNSRLFIAGEWEPVFREVAMKGIPQEIRERIVWAGRTADLRMLMSDAEVYVHPARGEAYGISVLEAMKAGLPVIVSEWTGASEVVRQVSPDLICVNTVESVTAKVAALLNKDLRTKQAISSKSRQVVAPYNEVSAVEAFEKVMKKIVNE